MRMRIVWYKRLWSAIVTCSTHLRMTVLAGGLISGNELASIFRIGGKLSRQASSFSTAERMNDNERALGRAGEYMFVKIDSRIILRADECRRVNVLSSFVFGYGRSSGSCRNGSQLISSSGSSGRESGVKPGRDAKLVSRPVVRLIVLSQL